MSAADPAAAAAGGRSSNRKWLVAMAATPVAVLAIAGVVYVVGPSEPSVGLTPPPGYQAIADAYWAYAIPSGWTQNAAYTDSNGDFYYNGRGGWVGETLRIRSTPPTLGEKPPVTLASFGQSAPSAYTLTDARATAVPGASTAFSYVLVRGRSRDRVVDAWVQGSRSEIWLVVQASSAVATTVTSSLRA